MPIQLWEQIYIPIQFTIRGSMAFKFSQSLNSFDLHDIWALAMFGNGRILLGWDFDFQPEPNLFWLHRGCFVSRKWVEANKWGSVISHFPIYPNTGKENWENSFSFSLFLLTQPFPHFQGVIVNFCGHVNLIWNKL